MMVPGGLEFYLDEEARPTPETLTGLALHNKGLNPSENFKGLNPSENLSLQPTSAEVQAPGIFVFVSPPHRNSIPIVPCPLPPET